MRRFFVLFTMSVLVLALSLGSLAQKTKGKEEPKKSEEGQKIEDLVTKGEYQKAIDLGKKFIEAGKVTAGLYTDMGTAYYNLKQYDEAIKSYEEAYKLDMFSAQNLLFEATCYHDMGQDDKVAETYEKVLGIEPTNNEVRYNLAQVYEKLAPMHKSSATMTSKTDSTTTSNNAPPVSSTTTSTTTVSLTFDDYINKALEQYEAIYASDPAFKDTAYAIALIHHNKGEMEKAEPYFEKALSLAPTNGDLLIAQGQNFIKEKKYDKAVVPLQKFLEVAKPDDMRRPAVTGNIAGIYYKAAGAVTVDPKAKPEDKKAAQDAINANYNNAIVYYDKFLVLRPNSEPALEGKANALLKLGKNAEAIAVLEQFMQVSKNDAEKKNVADVLKQLKAAKKS
jgi:tetratricopeptide (TPR) repeat protein